MGLGLTLAAVTTSLVIRNLVGKIAAKEPDKWRSDNNGQDNKAKLVEAELEAKDDGRGVLLRG